MTWSLLCRHNSDHVINDEHNRIISVVLSKHEIAPWWWFLREPKHVGASVGILIVFNIPMILYLCISVGIIKECFDTVDARCKHEECIFFFTKVPVILVRFGWISKFPNRFFETFSNTKFNENLSSGSRVIPCWRTDMKKLIVIFRNFAKSA
jgi:hypothetical protein